MNTAVGLPHVLPLLEIPYYSTRLLMGGSPRCNRSKCNSNHRSLRCHNLLTLWKVNTLSPGQVQFQVAIFIRRRSYLLEKYKDMRADKKENKYLGTFFSFLYTFKHVVILNVEKCNRKLKNQERKRIRKKKLIRTTQIESD